MGILKGVSSAGVNWQVARISIYSQKRLKLHSVELSNPNSTEGAEAAQIWISKHMESHETMAGYQPHPLIAIKNGHAVNNNALHWQAGLEIDGPIQLLGWIWHFQSVTHDLTILYDELEDLN